MEYQNGGGQVQGQDKPLCPCRGPGGQRIPSFRSHISRIPLSYFTPPPPPPSPFGPFGLSLIFCSLTFRPPRSRSPSISLDCSSLWRGREREGGLACLSLDASLWMNIARYPHCRGCFLCRHTYYVHVAEYIMQISYLRGGKVGSLESMQGGDHAGRRKEIFNFLVPSSFQS